MKKWGDSGGKGVCVYKRLVLTNLSPLSNLTPATHGDSSDSQCLRTQYHREPDQGSIATQ
jgi:hypothetical protein